MYRSQNEPRIPEPIKDSVSGHSPPKGPFTVSSGVSVTVSSWGLWDTSNRGKNIYPQSKSPFFFLLVVNDDV